MCVMCIVIYTLVRLVEGTNNNIHQIKLQCRFLRNAQILLALFDLDNGLIITIT